MVDYVRDSTPHDNFGGGSVTWVIWAHICDFAKHHSFFLFFTIKSDNNCVQYEQLSYRREQTNRRTVATPLRIVVYAKSIRTNHGNSAFHPSGVGKWVPASAGKAKAGVVHSISGWTRGVQVKLWDPLRTRAIPERLRGVFKTRRYTNPRLPLPLPYWLRK